MRLACAVAAGLILLAFLAQPARAADCWSTVTPDTAAAGDNVTVEIHKLGCEFWGDDLYIIPESSYESLLAQGRLCSEMAGALLIGSIDWVHHDAVHEGVIRFSVPDSADGTYVLGEDIPDVLPHCDRNGSLTVASDAGPDTAMKSAPWGTAAIAIGLSLILAAVSLAWRRGSPRRVGPGNVEDGTDAHW
jgi:hypothetical protein